jgi:integrase
MQSDKKGKAGKGSGNSSASVRGKKGAVGIQNRDGSIQFNLPRNWFSSGKQVRFCLGLPWNPANRAKAQGIASQMELDFNNSTLPDTVDAIKAKYRPKGELKEVEKDKGKKLTAWELWERHFKYKETSGRLKATTLTTDRSRGNKYIEPLKQYDCDDALAILECLIKHDSNHQIKRVLIDLNAAYEWGIKHRLTPSNHSPFKGMSAERPKFRYEEEPEPNAFSGDEMERVIQGYKEHKGNHNGRGYTGYKYTHYAPFVEFLFLTGCRPSEAVGLRWGYVSDDLETIIFDGSLLYHGSAWVRTDKSKNNKTRVFPVGERLKKLLTSIKPESCDPDSLVFPAPKGGAINYNNFGNKPWHTIADKVKQGTTPYSCRDTFITTQIGKGVSADLIGMWCDNSGDVIRKRYLDPSKLMHIKPID